MPVVVMTAFASIQLAVEAVRLGAKDFLQKPWENERLISILRTQVALRDALRGKERLEAENSALRSSQAPSAGFVANLPRCDRSERWLNKSRPRMRMS